MSLPSELLPVGLLGTGAAAEGYTISRSLRFNSADSAYLSRTPASAGNRKTWTWAGWVKNAYAASTKMFFAEPVSSTWIFFQDNQLYADINGSGNRCVTNAVQRDPSAWYHIVWQVDTTDATASNRSRIYVNGVLQTFSSSSYPAQNVDTGINNNVVHYLGSGSSGAYFFSGYLADIHFIDGQALDPTSFGEFDANGIWQPIEYTGTYPGNSFHLDFSDNSTAAALGTDTSGNGNDWTPNNIGISDLSAGPITSTTWYLYKLEFTATANGYVNQFVVRNNSIGTPYNSVHLVNILKNGSELAQNITASGGGGLDSTATYWTGPFNSRINQSPRLQNGQVGSPWGSGSYVGNASAYPELLAYSTSYVLGYPLTNDAPGSGPYTATFTGFSYSAGDTLSFYVASYSTSSGNDGYFIIKGGATTGSTNVLAEANPFGSSVLRYSPGGNDSLVDVPTNGTETDTGVGSEVRGNYATLNPLDVFNSPTLANGNLDLSNSSANYGKTRSTIGFDVGTTTGFYAEVTVTGASTDNTTFGIIDNSVFTAAQGNAGAYLLGSRGSGGGNTWWTTSGTSVVSDTSVSHANGQVIGIAIKNGKVYFAINNTWVLSGDPTTESNPAFSGLTGTYFLYFNCYQSNALVLNAGARPFAYTAPSGFKALCTANLDAPLVTKPSEYMDVALWTGNNTSGRSITGLEFSPDLVWIKSRSNSGSHAWFDALRSTNMLASDSTGAESSFGTPPIGGYVSAFNTDGFTLTNGSVNNTYVNESSYTYAGWCWDAGDTTDPANEDGSITSSVRANPSAGFSIVTYTGNGTGGATIGHGLGAKPAFVAFKNRDTGNVNWLCYHASLGAQKTIVLNLTLAELTDISYFNNTEPTSSVITLGNTGGVNESSKKFVAYCFAPVDGYNTISSWTGNGSSDGPFIYTGHRTRFLLYKRSDVANDWYIMDTARDTYNVSGTRLFPNLSNAEFTYTSTDLIDVTANGFKIRSSNAAINANGGTYIFMALAEHPFQYARAR